MVKVVAQNVGEGERQSDPLMFVGDVRRQQLVSEFDAPSQRVSSVSFIDGARNNWHRHSTEQVLVVTHGDGIVADANGEKRIKVGDIVLVQPNERHWHGASPGQDMTHLAILLPGTLTVDEDQS